MRCVLTSDHGSIHCERPLTVFARRDATANLRYKFGADLRAENRSGVYAQNNETALRFPRGGMATNYLLFDRVVFARDLGIPDFGSWIFRHDVVEACTAVKGPFLHQACGSGADAVIYLDPDTALFGSLEPIEHWLEEYEILLTPHLIDPNDEPTAIMDNDLSASRTGIFNLGFVAIRTRGEGARFAKWWNDRLLAYCYDDMESGLFVDQRFGVGRWAPLLLLLPASLALLLRGSTVRRVVLALIVTQLLIATFVAITMMGWWFPGRTLMTVLPLTPLPLTLLVLRMPAWTRIGTMALAALTFVFTAALRLATATGNAALPGEVTLAVDPFDMRFWLFRESARLFPNYQSWSDTTILLTVAWLAVLISSMGLVAWREYGNGLRALPKKLPAARGFRLRRA